MARGSLEWRLPRLTGIITAPTLRADGSVFGTNCYEAYDERTGLFVGGVWPWFASVQDRPDGADADEAFDDLDELAKPSFPSLTCRTTRLRSRRS